MHLTVVTLDFTDQQFEKITDFRDAVNELRKQTGIQPAVIYITSFQHKLFNLERYMQGTPMHVIKTTGLKDMCGAKVVIWDGDGQPPCPNCGNSHGGDIVFG